MICTSAITVAVLLAGWAILVRPARRPPPGLLRDPVGFLPACVITARRRGSGFR